MKLWNVSVGYVTVVVAENELEALQVARSHQWEIANDACGNLDMSVENQIKSAGDFECGWDADCIPYGGPADARIGDLNPALHRSGDAT